MTCRRNSARLFRKATNLKVSIEYLAKRTADLANKGWSKSKWIEFCEAMLGHGYDVWLYEARQTLSKYCTVGNPRSRQEFKVRFSNHRPIREREKAGDCDFFVGKCNFVTTNTAQAIAATTASLGPVKETPPCPPPA